MDLKISEMMEYQAQLQAKNFESWGGLQPETARSQLLWAMIEAGEAADLIKKRGDEAIVHEEELRAHFAEEIADTIMYLMDVLICCHVPAEEFEAAYRAKADRNLKRDFQGEHKSYLKDETK